jgi:mannose-6-phosphate isomerase-like protein (cupin superfamily)
MSTNCRIFELEALEREQRGTGEPWFEYLRVPSLRSGLYLLEPGAWDHQTPHEEDEMYFVVRGRARFEAGAFQVPVKAGSVIFVPARQEHRFTSIEESLQVLVFFASAPRH